MTAGPFTFSADRLALPRGAWASGERQVLRHRGRPVLALSQGRQRAYVYPLYTPLGFPVTSEAPADHPHHNSLWIASDHVTCMMPAADGLLEEYTYGFYVNETFQGRAPGRILMTAARGEPTGRSGYRLTQSLEWRGPPEWAAPEGRVAATETRLLDVSVETDTMVVDVTSRLAAADWDVRLGPTRHSYFNLRVAESIAVTSGGRLSDDRGRDGGGAITGSNAAWVDYSGPVGGGHVAGVSVCPHPADHADLAWFVTDWGVVTVGPFRNERREIRRGETTTLRYRVLVHDGDADTARVADRLSGYLAKGGR
ncbi:DUF6807 family protein [Microbaculum marinum]|uniref:DUF6807 family protein n=1 Tax=Microbaculum marinum TaxID=1764581 RepID=A0AAW9RJN2_9HYPH